MKKKSPIPPEDKKQISEPVSAYKVSPKDKINKELKKDSKEKMFNRTNTPQDFPEDCVTLDTFFSDLEDYIHQNEKI